MEAPLPPSGNVTQDSSNYISSRPPPSDWLDYHLETEAFSRTGLPSPESAWTGRDVTQQDWNVFMTQVEQAGSQPQDVITEWNTNFFAPRRCRILTKEAAGGEQQQQTEDKGAKTSSRWGWKIGKVFVGAGNVPEDGSTIGLSLGRFGVGVLLDGKDAGEVQGEAGKAKTS